MPIRSAKNRNIEVILLQDDKHLGEKYEIVSVRPIFAKNVLFPQNVAVLADKVNKNKFEQKMKAAELIRQKKATSLEDLFVKITEDGGIVLVRKVNKDNVLYAKVSEADIVAAIEEIYGVKIENHLLKLKKKINEVGTFVVPFIYKDMKKEVIVLIQAENDGKEVEKNPEVKETVVEKTKEELKEERDAKRAIEKAEKIAKLKEKYK